MELEQNNTYIFKTIRYHNHIVFKGRVEELTETTIKITNLDTDISFRYELKEFEKEYKTIELVTDFEKELREAAKETNFQMYHPEWNNNTYKHYGMVGCICSGKCTW